MHTRKSASQALVLLCTHLDVRDVHLLACEATLQVAAHELIIVVDDAHNDARRRDTLTSQAKPPMREQTYAHRQSRRYIPTGHADQRVKGQI